MVQETYDSLTEREKAILRSASTMQLREYCSSAQSPHLTKEGNSFIKTIFPEPITRGELEALLAPIPPGQELNYLDYVREMEDLLIQEPSPLREQPLYQHLLERLERLAGALDDYDLTLRNFHVLLGIHVLNTGVEQGLISPGEEQYCFRRNI